MLPGIHAIDPVLSWGYDEGIEGPRPPSSERNGVMLIYKRVIALLASVLMLILVGGSVLAASTSVNVAENARLGTILVNAQGFTLYHLTAENAGKIVCTAACTKLWPPLLSSSMPAAESSVPAGSLSLVSRPGGTKQVAYKGMPLYMFAHDTAAGQTNGQGFKGVWFAEAIAAPSSSGGTSSTSSGYTAPSNSTTTSGAAPSVMPRTGGGEPPNFPGLPIVLSILAIGVGVLLRRAPLRSQ